MNTATKTKRAARARDRDIIRTSQPSPAATQKLRLNRVSRLVPDYVDSTLGNKSGFATYSLEVGDVTYRALTWGIVCDAEIDKVTTEIGGIHYVDIDRLADYIGMTKVVANGTVMQEFSMAELVQLNDYRGITYGPVHSGYAYPGSNTYSETDWTDAFALGTRGLRSLTLELQLKAAFAEDTMEIVVMPHAVDMVKPVGFTFTTERLNDTWQGAGKHTYNDLPVGDDVSSIWLIADNIKSVKLTIDGDKMYDMTRAQYEAYLIENGRDVEALDGSWLLDIHAEGKPRSIAALDKARERTRDARIKLDVVTMDESTPVELVVTHADIYSRIR